MTELQREGVSENDVMEWVSVWSVNWSVAMNLQNLPEWFSVVDWHVWNKVIKIVNADELEDLLVSSYERNQYEQEHSERTNPQSEYFRYKLQDDFVVVWVNYDKYVQEPINGWRGSITLSYGSVPWKPNIVHVRNNFNNGWNYENDETNTNYFALADWNWNLKIQEELS